LGALILFGIVLWRQQAVWLIVQLLHICTGRHEIPGIFEILLRLMASQPLRMLPRPKAMPRSGGPR
jgi:hypothetical protein